MFGVGRLWEGTTEGKGLYSAYHRSSVNYFKVYRSLLYWGERGMQAWGRQTTIRYNLLRNAEMEASNVYHRLTGVGVYMHISISTSCKA